MITRYPVISKSEFRQQVGDGFKFEDVSLIDAPDQPPPGSILILVDQGKGLGVTLKRRFVN